MSECVQHGELESAITRMRTISAVKTTGIYCRQGCGARPLPGNVRGFSLAAAAGAGYRACMWCRPYRTQPSTNGSGPEAA